nr:uncharacterized protein LOC122173017 [Chrysemys picta bellii]
MSSSCHGWVNSFMPFPCFPSLARSWRKRKQTRRPPDHPSLVPATLVQDPPGLACGPSVAVVTPPGPTLPGPGPLPPPQSGHPPFDSVADQGLDVEERRCSEGVRHVLLESRKPSTRRAYLAKWSRFSRWAGEWGTSPVSALLQLILEYLLHLRTQGLAPSSVRVHLAAILAFHPLVQGCSVFSHAMTRRFLKGLDWSFPYAKTPVPQWDLNLVLSRLTGPPFELLATCSWSHLSWKVAFLVAITSAPLDVRRAFYLDWTKPFRSSLQLFVASAERMRGQPISTQRLSRWITSCIHTCYDLAGVPAPPIIRAHSTRARASSSAFVHAFMSRYAIVSHARDDAVSVELCFSQGICELLPTSIRHSLQSPTVEYT